MASNAPAQGLPLLYNDLVPLSSSEHGGWKMRRMENLNLIREVHAVPLTVEEFAVAHRFFPIVFSAGSDPVPLALMGLNEGVNVYLDDDGGLVNSDYLPAYVRRYPFMLARLRPESEDMTLCFDPAAGLIGEFEDGEPLFENGEITQRIKDTLAFSEQFEVAGQRTAAFVKELQAADLLIEGEVSIQPEGMAQPYVYRGFQMIAEEKLRELRGDQLRKMNQNGMLAVIHAHLFSLGLVSEVFGRQMRAGKVPPQLPSVA